MFYFKVSYFDLIHHCYSKLGHASITHYSQELNKTQDNSQTFVV